jgi:hypothetical protein
MASTRPRNTYSAKIADRRCPYSVTTAFSEHGGRPTAAHGISHELAHLGLTHRIASRFGYRADRKARQRTAARRTGVDGSLIRRVLTVEVGRQESRPATISPSDPAREDAAKIEPPDGSPRPSSEGRRPEPTMLAAGSRFRRCRRRCRFSSSRWLWRQHPCTARRQVDPCIALPRRVTDPARQCGQEPAD